MIGRAPALGSPLVSACLHCQGPAKGKYCSPVCYKAEQARDVAAWRAKRRACPVCLESFGPRPREQRSAFERRRLCSTSCASLEKRGKLHSQAPKEAAAETGWPSFATEPERLAFMRGIWVGWQRGVASHEQWGDATGNLLMDAISWSVTGLPIADEQKAEIYRRAASFPIPTARIPKPEQKARRSNRAVLSEKAVREIRSLYRSGEYSQEDLGKRFGVHRATIRQIVIGKTWRRPQESGAGLLSSWKVGVA